MKKSLFTAFAVGLGITTNLMAQVPSYVPSNGLVGWWPFNGNANDESGNGNNGTVNGATLTTDRFGNANQAYGFDGVNDIISLQNSSNFNFNNGKAISFWVKINAFPISGESILISQQSSSSTSAIGFNISVSSSGKLNYRIGNGSSTTYSGVLNNSVSLNDWYHVVCQYEGGIQSVYFNSLLINSSIQPSALVGNPNLSLVIGDDTWGAVNANNFNGSIDEIAIWNRSISNCEILDLFHSQLNYISNSLITVNPQTTSIGSNVAISTPTQSQNIQWQNNPLNNGWQNVPNNTNYSVGTTNTLTVSNVQLSNHNQPFRVIASSGNCIDTSNIATIQIADTCITNITVYDTLLTTVTDTLIINTTLGLPAPNNENTILIYPNPASDHITIDNGNYTAMAGYTIRIENNAGQQVFQNAINQQQFYVDLSTWSGNGLYFVHLIDPQYNTVKVRKIVLQ